MRCGGRSPGRCCHGLRRRAEDALAGAVTATSAVEPGGRVVYRSVAVIQPGMYSKREIFQVSSSRRRSS